jgi:hypothetical protein
VALGDKATFTRGRRLAIGLNVLVVSLLAPLVAGLLLYLAFRPELRQRVDLTSRGTFTLADRTLRILEGLQKPVDVYTCFRPVPLNEAGQPAPGMDAVIATIALHTNDMLREFEVRSRGKVRSHPYDPNMSGHLARIGELQTMIGEPALNLAVVTCDERRRVVHMKELAEYDAGTRTTTALTESRIFGFRDEEALAKAILSVTEAHAVTIGFLVGHGERSPLSSGTDASGRAGLAIWAKGLADQNYQLGRVELHEGKPLGKDEIDVLVVADPSKPLAPWEIDTVVRYAKDGGKVALLLGPGAANSLDFPLLEQVYGIARTPHPVCQVSTFGDFKLEANAFYSSIYGEHPIVRPLKSAQLMTFWRDVCALRPGGTASGSALVQTPLVWSGNDAWIDLPDEAHKYNHQFDPGNEDRNKGPYMFGYAVEPANAGRAVALGCASLLDDADVNRATGNRSLGLNLVDWLTAREQLISIAPKPFDVVQVDLTPKEFNTIFLYVVLGVPGIALLLGVAVFWMRRN